MSRVITLQVDLVIEDGEDAEDYVESVASVLDDEFDGFKECRVMWS
jgi:hypothetical protein